MGHFMENFEQFSIYRIIENCNLPALKQSVAQCAAARKRSYRLRDVRGSERTHRWFFYDGS